MPDPIPTEGLRWDVDALIAKHGHGLTEWQERLVRACLSGVPVDLVMGHGRRAGYTTALSVLEACLHDRRLGALLPEEDR